MFFSEGFISASEIPLHLLKTVNSMMLNNVVFFMHSNYNLKNLPHSIYCLSEGKTFYRLYC